VTGEGVSQRWLEIPDPEGAGMRADNCAWVGSSREKVARVRAMHGRATSFAFREIRYHLVNPVISKPTCQ